MFDFIVRLITDAGYVGIAALMFAENVFPPIPSELIMPFAGFVAARGELSLPGVILAGSFGSLAGMHVWYEVGRAIGARRLERWAARRGRWIGLSPVEVLTARAWFDRRGAIAVLVGRLVPTVRTLISVPAGIVRMPRLLFLGLSAIGTVCWTMLLSALGFLLEARYELVAGWINPVATAVVAVLVAIYLWRVITFDRRRLAAQVDECSDTTSNKPEDENSW